MGRPNAAFKSQGPGAATAAVAITNALMLGRQIRDLLQKILDSTVEREPDFDQTFVVGGSISGATVIPISIPRTIKHVEITLNGTTTGAGVTVALLDGNVALAQAQRQHNVNAMGASNAVCALVNNGSVKARDYLGGTGYLTVFFSAGGNGWVNVRVRNLDKTQARLRRT